MPWFVWIFTNRLCCPRMRPPRTPLIRSSEGLDDRGVLSTASASAARGLARAAPPRAPAEPLARNERRDLGFAMPRPLPGPLLEELLDLLAGHGQRVDV